MTIGVVFQGILPEGGLDLVIANASGYTQSLVRVGSSMPHEWW